MPAGRASWRLFPASGGVSVFWLVCVVCPLVLSVARWCDVIQVASTVQGGLDVVLFLCRGGFLK